MAEVVDLDKVAIVALEENMMPDYEERNPADRECCTGIGPTAHPVGKSECAAAAAVEVVEIVAFVDEEEREGKTKETANRVAEESDKLDEIPPLTCEMLEQTICAVDGSLTSSTHDSQQMHAANPGIKVDVARKPLTKEMPPAWKEPELSLSLLGLPIDSLHGVASFLTASDWASFGLTNTIATPICRDVFHRVRMHGFRCATEVVTAWVSERIKMPNLQSYFQITEFSCCVTLRRNWASNRMHESLRLFISRQAYRSTHYPWDIPTILSFGKWESRCAKGNKMGQKTQVIQASLQVR